MEQRFPRLWRPSKQDRDLRQLLIHRHRLVGIRTRVKNGLQHLMLNKGVQLRYKLWSEAGQKMLRELPLPIAMLVVDGVEHFGWGSKSSFEVFQMLRGKQAPGMRRILRHQ